MRWVIGDITVTRIEESVGFTSKPPSVFFPEFDRACFDRHLSWMAPVHYDPSTDQLVSSIHSWLIRTPNHTILFDSCAGNHRERPWAPRWHMLDTPWLARLRAAGAAPEDVDFVLCSHLHVDHCGWNTMNVDGRWVPTFPNARYLIHRREHDNWNPHSPTRGPRAQLARALWDDSVLPVLESGQVTLIQGDHEIERGVTITEAPGHTPGLVVMKIAASDQHGVFCSDVIHHPVQICNPDWNTIYCEVPDQARSSRHRLIEHCLAKDAILFPGHFAVPHAACIRQDPSGLRPVFVDHHLPN